MIIDGRKIAQEILTGLKAEIPRLPFRPLFCDVLVGNDPVSLSYVKIKGRCAEQVGISFKLVSLNANITEDDLTREIKKLNQLENICGLIVQLPLPAHLSREKVLIVLPKGI